PAGALSLHDALPISIRERLAEAPVWRVPHGEAEPGIRVHLPAGRLLGCPIIGRGGYPTRSQPEHGQRHNAPYGHHKTLHEAPSRSEEHTSELQSRSE